ncbi:hypothetical protein IFM89_004101 [Coptis chinensis]|uniref:mRNA-decapping enzyme-like protein n=1 Tax=Coptis chinensis TaxID=261450 RepID=A0A835H6C2_9MAGN|nr:hypothetical protein IFM89_004101 [Coptis chinensis]
MTQITGKLMPNLDQQSTKILNLTVLQRIDPFVEEILITAAHVTFYEFNIDLNQWSRKDVEGSLFVVKRILNAYSKVPPKPKVPSIKSEFEELEAVPTMAVMEGPLEPTSSTSSAVANVPDDSPFVNFFSAAMNIGNTSNAVIPGQHQHPPAAVPLPSHAPSVLPSPVSSHQSPSPLPVSATPRMPLLDIPDLSGNHAANLVKPSSFFAPPPSSPALMVAQTSSSMTPSIPSAPPMHPPVNLQRPYGTPMLQPFPPPTPSPSLTPAPTPNYGPVISKDKVREALMRVLQKDEFIDMFYQELLNAHYS